MPKQSLFLLLLVFAAAEAGAREYQLYYLGGQSNMDGFGHVKELPDELKAPVTGVRIFHGNQGLDTQPPDGRGLWAELQPGHGTGFESDGKANRYSDRFGVELSFARHLRQLNPAAHIAIIKYSRGGTSIAAEAAGQFGCWEPDFKAGTGAGRGINQYDHFLATLQQALSAKDIDGDGEEDTLIPAGILWMQGESDATRQETADRYEANLKRLMDLIRAALRTDDLPVAIGRISDSNHQNKAVWKFGPVVRDAQAMFCEKDVAATLITTTDAYGYSDPWHYDSKGYIDLGLQFAKTLHDLKQAPLTRFPAWPASGEADEKPVG